MNLGEKKYHKANITVKARENVEDVILTEE